MTLSDLLGKIQVWRLERLPRPTNAGLQKLVRGIDTIVIKEGGVSRGKAHGKTVVLTISDPPGITSMIELMEFFEPEEAFGCMCSGDYAIELYKGKKRRNTIGFHHGYSIRFDGWNSDAVLTKADQLLLFLAERGLRTPLGEKLEAEKRGEAYDLQFKKWLAIAPKCFAGYVEQLNAPLGILEEELDLEIPDIDKRVIHLLKTYGCTENPWTGYFSYEGLSYQLLSRIYIGRIIGAYLDSDRSHDIRKGLGRFLCGYESFQKKDIFLKHISLNVLDELQECFKQTGNEEGKDRVAILRKEKELLSDI